MKALFDILNFREIGVFNSREVAIFIFLCVLIILLFYNKKNRSSLLNVIKATFARRLVIVYIIAILYSGIPIIILHNLGFWRISLTKELVFWLIFSAFPVLIALNKADEKFFTKAIKENIQLTVIIDFITSQHTFNVFAELLLVIFGVFSGLMIAYVSGKEEYKNVYKLFNTILLLLGCYLFLNSLYYFVKYASTFTSMEKFQEFSLPITLGFWFIPFLYGLYIYMIYETIFIAMRHAIKNESIRKYAMRRAFFGFGFNLKLLRRWKDSLLIREPTTKEDVLISILDMTRLELVEKNPPKVDFSRGWSPYESKDFLNSDGIYTNYYKNIYDDEWLAISPYVDLNNELLGNNVSYYVLGNSSVAKKLELVLNVNFPVEGDLAIAVFMKYVNTLYNKALSEELPLVLSNSIYKKRNKVIKVSNKKVSIQKTEYSDRLSGYTLTFALEQE